MAVSIDYYVVRVVSDQFFLYISLALGVIGTTMGIINFIDYYKRRAWTYHKKVVRRQIDPEPFYPPEVFDTKPRYYKKGKKIKKTSGAPF